MLTSNHSRLVSLCQAGDRGRGSAMAALLPLFPCSPELAQMTGSVCPPKIPAWQGTPPQSTFVQMQESGHIRAVFSSPIRVPGLPRPVTTRTSLFF